MTAAAVNAGMEAYVSIGVMAWNEEKSIGRMLDSLFGQSLFAELARQNLACEVVCVANGCTDRTTAVAAQSFEQQLQEHPHRNRLSKLCAATAVVRSVQPLA